MKEISIHRNVKLMSKNREVFNWVHVYYRTRMKQADVFILTYRSQVAPLAIPNHRDKLESFKASRIISSYIWKAGLINSCLNGNQFFVLCLLFWMIIAKFLMWIHHNQQQELTPAMNQKLEGITLICETQYYTETIHYFSIVYLPKKISLKRKKILLYYYEL